MESNVMLWQFLLEILKSEKFYNIIRWTDSRGEFKLIDAEEVARMWGLRKNKTNMNYDKLSRALRYYYQKNIIQKVLGQKFVYRFVSIPWVEKDLDEDSPSYFFNSNVEPASFPFRGADLSASSRFLNQPINLSLFPTSDTDELLQFCSPAWRPRNRGKLGDVLGHGSDPDLGHGPDRGSAQNCRFCGSPSLDVAEKMDQVVKCWRDLCSKCHSHLGAVLCRLLISHSEPRKEILLEQHSSDDNYSLVMRS